MQFPETASGRSTTTVEIDEAETRLIGLARAGDHLAWERLVQRYQEPVFRLAYLIMADAHEAEDVAQDAFIRAYLKLEQYDVARPLRPWLLQITANLARNRRRSIGRYWAALTRYGQTVELDTRNPEPDESQQLWQAVRALRPKAQEIIYLRYFLALSEAEAAAALNIAPGTAKSRLHRALQQLKVVIEKKHPDLQTAWGEMSL